ncbi:MAG: hypothetical protein D6711_02020 [Chloroflexi bacterium]|nr:MAG: hypothetical protein D6711_02020 [Chloroflexota bacterium]
MTNTHFIGRSTELKQLNDAYQNMLKSGKGSLIFVTGELGIGKTALVEQFNAVRDRKKKIKYAYTKSSQITKDRSAGFDVFIRLFQSLAQQSMVNDDNLKDKVTGFFREYGSDIVPDIFNLIPFVGQYIGTAIKLGLLLGKANSQNYELASLSDAHGRLDQTNVTQNKFIDSLRNLSKKQPLILFLDDLQWADESSTNLLFALTDELAKIPILLVAGFRPQDATVEKRPIIKIYPEIIRKGDYHKIELKELGHDNIPLYLNKRFSTTKFVRTSSLVEWLIEMTNGHSLFLTEYVDYLIAKEGLTNDGQLRTDLQKIGLPPKSEEIIRARVDTLDKELQEMLAYASCEGQEFTTLILESLLEKLSDKTYPNIFSQLRDLKEVHQLIKDLGLEVRYNHQTTIYQFSNKMLHSFLLNQWLEEEERQRIFKILHEIKANLYNQTDDAEKAQLVGELEWYAAETKDYLSEAKSALDRARIAAERYAIPELKNACENATKALEKIPGEDSQEVKSLRLDYLLQLGRLYDLELKQRRAKDTYNQAEKLAQEIGAKDSQAKALNRLGFLIYWTHGGPRQAAKRFRQARDILIELGNNADKKDLATAYIGLGIVTRKSEEALEYYQEALQIYEELDDPRGKATCYHNIGALQEDDEEALQYYQKSLNLHNQYNLPDFERGNTYANIGEIYFRRQEYQPAIVYFKKSLEVQVGVNDSHTHYAYRGLGLSLSWIGEIDKSIEAIRKSIETAKNVKDNNYVALGYRDLGQLYRLKAMYSEALNALEEALRVKYRFKKAEERDFLKSIYKTMRLVYCELGNIEQANECLRKIEEL